jgi:SRSO17 transposase
VLTDRELYVPKSWIGDRGRCGEAGIGDDVRFATKPELARKMIGRAVSLGLPFAWFTADEAYGDNGRLREWLAENTISYVVAVSCDHRVPAGAGKTIRADHLAAKVPGRGWQRLSCGPGSKGERLYDWALAPAGQGRTLLIRRSRAGGEHAYYLCWSPRNTTLSELVKVAGARWAVGMLPGRQERDRAGPLPGPQAPGLVPARHPGARRPGLARRRRGQAAQDAARRPRPGQRGGPQPVDNHPARSQPQVTA